MSLTKYLSVVLLFLGTAFTTAQAQSLKTPAPSPNQKVTQAFGLSEISVDYSRPSMKGRTIFGSLVPYDKIWRTGANGATLLTFGQEVMLQGMKVPAGTYALYTMPGKNKWTVMLYKDLDMAGSVNEYKKSDELLRFDVMPKMLKDKVETFTIEFANLTSNSADIQLLWDDVCVSMKATVEIDQMVMDNISKMMAKDSRPYYQAANYYYDNGKDMNKALEWVNTAISQNPKAYYMYATKARIELKMNKKAEATMSAKKVIELAKEAKSEDYVAIGNDLLKQAK